MRLVWILLLLAFDASAQRNYYVSGAGNDRDDGSLVHPWKSLAPLAHLRLHAGDGVLFHGGETFSGVVRIEFARGTAARPVVVCSYGSGVATLSGGDSSALILYASSHVNVFGLHLVGVGRKAGNVKEGLVLVECRSVSIDSVNITGFQKSGLMVYSSVDVLLTRVFAHENGAAGISVEGLNKKSSRNIRITWCKADDNPGDPSNLTNHSGNGIVVGHCTSLRIDHCSATNNGWDMPRIGNGPVGIWCYEADSVTIEHCLSYRNKTSVGGADGGGFDLDGGTTHSVIQYCLSYGNQGSGYCIFQYWGASPFHDNVIRHNITVDDGTVSDSRAGMYVWNSSDDSTQFYNVRVYDNTVYCSKEAAVSYSEKSERRGFLWSNNIFIGGDSLIRGLRGSDRFVNNDWWCLAQPSLVGPGMHVNPGVRIPGKLPEDVREWRDLGIPVGWEPRK